ncbi:Putative glycosyltransferase EpsH [Mariniflexile rhizosphaerae]|uniref:glycosyltransferase family 2 protein n=1 Tax=unclassified Mariniflexile TaxID=2643887 RepID=UPI000CBEEC5E|nr:glycosyltransferase [Mariniflexile sp. TRM1-10]AXP79472.1 Putative glycosyltransferase EpsH [Mariniflexile sp. TRM1-10]PLB19426.1 MAG: Glycosyl transferase family 2 [Flavobacteriaceae bacterium FS1-H7996/R]
MKHDEPLVSIIITFYNEEKLLARCLESVKNQIYKNLEVVLINDGSTDNSLQIAENFESYFENIKIFTIKNSGLSEARNHGLSAIKGEYVTFLDADDELEKEMISICIDKIIKEKSDLVLCRFSVINKNGDVEFVSGWKDNLKDIKRTSELIPQMFSYGISETVWGKIYKSDIAKRIKFVKGIWFEDTPYLLEYLFLASNAYLIKESLLKIHKRDTSITRRVLEEKRILDYQRVFELELSTLKKYQGESKLKNKIAKYYLDMIVGNYLFQVIDKDYIINLTHVRKIFHDTLMTFKKVLKDENISLSIKDKLQLQLLEIHRFLGWDLSNQIFKFLKQKRIQAINKLR